MARRTSRTARTAKKPKPEKRRSKPAPVKDVEIVEESGGSGWGTAVAVITGLILLVAFVCVDLQRGWYGEGLFGG